MTANQKSCSWELSVTVFDKTWLPLPGSAELWPMNVRANGKPVAVVEREGSPAIQLEKGVHRLAGEFRYEEMPQRIEIPKQVGVLTLVLDGKKVEIPNWDESGNLWLKRVRIEATDKDTLTVQVYRVIEDGIPMWLHTEIELSVSGKSREEELGWLVPDGWKLSMVDSPVPVAVDDDGRVKAQVRAGKWRIRADAFRASDLGEFKFAPSAAPITKTELVAFKASPEFRMAEIEGIHAVDVSQTTFPEQWRNLPVYSWETGSTFRLVEKMRGMGLQKPEGLGIRRQFWLDEDGKGLTFSDSITGRMQQIWRLDIAEGQELGAVRVDGRGQLITANPKDGAHGVEVRARNLNMEAIGRMNRAEKIPATGWRTDANSLQISLNLPPGWRLFALFGADWVSGDWLTSWTLLDLFLLLIFSVAVFRLWGFKAGIVAFIAFGLAYHEPAAPRYTWFLLLIPLALLRMVPEGTARKWIVAWKYIAVAALVLLLVPFVAGQIQGALYPQLEPQGMSFADMGVFRGGMGVAGGGGRVLNQETMSPVNAPQEVEEESKSSDYALGVLSMASSVNRVQAGKAKWQSQTSNLAYDAKAKIQTGPALPEWSWNMVRCGWNGPVSAKEKIHPIFISLRMHRFLTLVRLAFLVMLVAILLGVRSMRIPFLKSAATAAVVLLALFAPARASAEFPDKEMLGTLRERLLETSDAYPNAAEIPSVELKLSDGKIDMAADIHTAIRVAVPLPGRLPSWSPVSVKVDGAAGAVLRRDDGYLWVVVPEGVHRVTVEGLLPNATEWEWTFLLKPRHVSIDAPGWKVTGVRPTGVPEQQVFFSRQRKATEGEAAYDRKDFNAIVAVDRHLEVGLVWQVRNQVTRLPSAAKAVSLESSAAGGREGADLERGGRKWFRRGAARRGRQDFLLGKRAAGH